MTNLERIGNSLSVSVSPDEGSLTGRECPASDCGGYFKVEFGTGLKGEDLPCRCPYCGHTASHDQCWTREQIEYANSVASREITEALHKDLKKMEFDYKPKGAFGIGISLKVKPGRPMPIHYYREKELETEVVCSNCTLRYSVYGVFAFCPDCGQRNSLQILLKNLELVLKILGMAEAVELELAEVFIGNALEDWVSAFDGFGREISRIHARKSTDSVKAEKMSFQNLEGARQSLVGLFGIDLAAGLTAEEWKAATNGFQKRHLLSHNMGVVDKEYIRRSDDPRAVVGRKISVSIEEVRELVRIADRLARYMAGEITKLQGSP